MLIHDFVPVWQHYSGIRWHIKGASNKGAIKVILHSLHKVTSKQIGKNNGIWAHSWTTIFKQDKRLKHIIPDVHMSELMMFKTQNLLSRGYHVQTIPLEVLTNISQTSVWNLLCLSSIPPN